MIVQPDYLTARPILEMSSGGLAILLAVRLGSSRVSSLAAYRRPGSFLK